MLLDAARRHAHDVHILHQVTQHLGSTLKNLTQDSTLTKRSFANGVLSLSVDLTFCSV